MNPRRMTRAFSDPWPSLPGDIRGLGPLSPLLIPPRTITVTVRSPESRLARLQTPTSIVHYGRQVAPLLTDCLVCQSGLYYWRRSPLGVVAAATRGRPGNGRWRGGGSAVVQLNVAGAGRGLPGTYVKFTTWLLGKITAGGSTTKGATLTSRQSFIYRCMYVSAYIIYYIYKREEEINVQILYKYI